MSHSSKYALIFLATVLAFGPAVSVRADKVALLVGVNEYEKRGYAERPLRFAERDVDQMAIELRKHGFRVSLLKGSSTNAARATKKNFETALAKLLEGRNATDIVLLGFAGHGQQMPLRDEDGGLTKNSEGRTLEDAFFCPVDAMQGKPESMVSLTKLVERLKNEGGVNLGKQPANGERLPGEAW